jgi:hypothetical protein
MLEATSIGATGSGEVGKQADTVGDQRAEAVADFALGDRRVLEHVMQVADDLCLAAVGGEQCDDRVKVTGIRPIAVALATVGSQGKGACFVKHGSFLAGSR